MVHVYKGGQQGIIQVQDLAFHSCFKENCTGARAIKSLLPLTITTSAFFYSVWYIINPFGEQYELLIEQSTRLSPILVLFILK